MSSTQSPVLNTYVALILFTNFHFLYLVMQAFIIAFTSEFIPKLVYRYSVSPDEDMKGYINWSLSTFNVADFEDDTRPDDPNFAEFGNVTECRYVVLFFAVVL